MITFCATRPAIAAEFLTASSEISRNDSFISSGLFT